jgi:transcriptional regulator NrdR family protein
MTTREWTKILKENPKVSTIKVDSENVRGTITITRHRIIEKEERHYTFNQVMDRQTIIVKESEIDVTFKGKVQSAMGNWYPPKEYNTRTLNNWFRRSKDINEGIKMRLKLIGGSAEYKIKKITCL